MKAAVLLLDDEPALLETLALILEGNGYIVATAATVQDGLKLVGEREFDLLLADLSMPGDGGTVIAVMRRRQPRTPIIVITGHVMPDAVPEGVRAQVDLILTKPTDIPGLLKEMARLLG